MKATRHNGRSGKHGTYDAKHNDRRFDVENSEHIDAERKGSIQTTQEIEIYFNFVGRYVPPAMMTEPTPEEQEEIDRINRIKDKRHQQYLRRKESGWQRKYEERVKSEKRAKIEAMKEEIRRQDRENGVYATLGSLALEPKIGTPR